MTENHISDELPRLLTGEAPRAVVLSAADHLRSCADCQQELVSAVIAHASLSSAQRFAPEVVRPVPAAEQAAAEAPALPDLEAVFRQVREEADTGSTASPRRRRVLYAAAAAAVVVGGGTAIAIVESGSSSSPGGQTVALRQAGSGAGPVTATIRNGGRMTIDASTLPRLDATHQYEVWLTKPNADPQPIGFIGADRTGQLTVPGTLMTQYDTIAISKQRRNQVAFSGITVAAGNYG
jgi:anti-sigma-K factor RskA